MKIRNNQEQSVYSFSREKDGDKILVILNLTAKQCTVKFPEGIPADKWEPVFDKVKLPKGKAKEITLAPWQFLVYEKH